MTETDWGQTLAHWLDRLAGLHPREIELGLERVSAVWRCLGSPRPGKRLLIVGGTNGKGSCVAMLETILRATGCSTGTYTSPHLYRYNERIRLDGVEADDESICRAFEQVDRARGETPLTYFEFGTLAACQILAQRVPDVAILEVGLGGRLDAVNILDGDVALVTNVALEHVDWLGRDRECIGREKAGIFRAGAGAVVGESCPPQSVLDTAAGLRVDLLLAGRDFRHRDQGWGWDWSGRKLSYAGLPLPALPGAHQRDNAAAVLMVLELLGESVAVTPEAIAEGLVAVSLAGRFELRPGPVPIILDVAHNPAAAEVLAENLDFSPCGGRTLAVFGVLADKDIGAMVEPLRHRVDVWMVAPPQDRRALALDRLQGALVEHGVSPVLGFDRLEQALAAARQEARPGDRILVFGSFITVAEVGRLL